MKNTILRLQAPNECGVAEVSNGPAGGQLSPQYSKWKEERKKYIGGSDAAGVLALSRWNTPMSVWAEKAGLVSNDEPESLPQELGKKLEPVVADLFCNRTGKKVRRSNRTIFHPEHSFLAANIDRVVIGEDAGLECKTASAWKAKEWDGEEIPREYIIQCQHYLAVTGKQRWYLAVLIGNQDFKWKVIERNENLLKDIIRREVAFWNDYVLTKQMPGFVSRYDGDTLDRLYPQAQRGKEIQLTDEANLLVENLEGYKADRKNLDGLIDQTENQLKQLLGDAEVGITSLHKISWRNSFRSGLDGELLEAEMPEIHAKYYKQKPIRRFTHKTLAEAQ